MLWQVCGDPASVLFWLSQNLVWFDLRCEGGAASPPAVQIWGKQTASRAAFARFARRTRGSLRFIAVFEPSTSSANLLSNKRTVIVVHALQMKTARVLGVIAKLLEEV